MTKNNWLSGEQAYFEYHCWQSHKSSDAELWYKSQQLVLILGVAECDAKHIPDLDTYEKRTIAAVPLMYQVKFGDGLEYTAFEDELLISPQSYDPAFAPGTAKAKELDQ